MASQKAIGFVGVDEFSLEMAHSAIRRGYGVRAFEINNPVIEEIVKLGGVRCSSPSEAGRDVTALVILISHIDQTNDLIFGDEGALKGLKPDTVLILRSTLLPSFLHKLEKDLAEIHEIAYVVDAYVSYGRSDALNGKVIIASSGRLDAIARAHHILTAMCEKLFTFEGEIGGGSKVKMVNVMLEGIHFINAVEALSLGAKIGIHPWIIYDIISNAAGNSWAFKNYLPLLLKGEVNLQILNTFIKELETILNMSKSLTFPLPILAATHLQLIHGASLVDSGEDVTVLTKVWEKVYGVKILDAANADAYNPEQLASKFTTDSKSVRRIGFIGLGAMGFGMATHLLSSEFCVVGYDVYKPTLKRFTNAGGLIGNSPAEVSKDVEVLIIMVTNESQAENVLFGENGAVSALTPGASIILSSTVSPAYVSQLEHRLQSMLLLQNLFVLNLSTGIVPVNFTVSGTHHCCCCRVAAAAVAGAPESTGDHTIGSVSAGRPPRSRKPTVANSDPPPRSPIDTLLKQLVHFLFMVKYPHVFGVMQFSQHVILSTACHLPSVPLPVTIISIFLYFLLLVAGGGKNDLWGVIWIGIHLGGNRVNELRLVDHWDAVVRILKSKVFELKFGDISRLSLLTQATRGVLDVKIQGSNTGTKVDCGTDDALKTLSEKLYIIKACSCCLHKSRYLIETTRTILIHGICAIHELSSLTCHDISFAVRSSGKEDLLSVRHEEAKQAVEVSVGLNSWFILGFVIKFLRHTILDMVRYAFSFKQITSGVSDFSKGSQMFYHSCDLTSWVIHLSIGIINAKVVTQLDMILLITMAPPLVILNLDTAAKSFDSIDYSVVLRGDSTLRADAVRRRQMAEYLLLMQLAELTGKRFLCRTAASFVSALMGIISKPPILPSDLGIANEKNGGLIVVGSYVPKTTKQVEELKLQCGQFLKSIEVSVEKLAMSPIEAREEEISRTAELADVYLKAHKDTLIMTSRNLITGRTAAESLDINYKVSSALVEIVKRVTTKPRYIIAKGGITSSDLATKALGARCAKIVGQALAGIPLWLLGPESRHPGIPYIVFPGNVGNSTALAEVVKSWTHPIIFTSTKEILNNAEKGGYAVGAFNVYNLEGVEAVVSAAEEEQSPAILQIHPGALKQGGIPLVACCISAAKQASVPITVHFDHGTSKQDLVEALDLGFSSIMVDGSHLSFNENAAYTKFITLLAHSKNMLVEAELGRLSGTEDDLTVEEFEARLTDVNMASKFIDETGIDALAVCIGNVHGKYPASGPNLRLDLLKELHALSLKKGVYLVLHGASGLSKELVKECINLGVRKFNVNTEVRKAYMDSLINPKNDLVHVMASAKEAMKAVVAEKMHLFGSAGKA
ncbi:uncharacterized protein HKW66_Vig0122120 [Vigna angularis]|uniref:Uncharacterized protein n=1 Tax=Phaseolus angularis TaxID=3914 RepID=A0A8T0JZP7_PHAAN|nr:uncharacterized protein HKW66_Vig0122120 [Vigna angularis]